MEDRKSRGKSFWRDAL